MVLAFDWTAILVAVFTGSVATAALGYLGQRLIASGRVRTTNADTLWKEAERQRMVLERDNERLRGECEETAEALFGVRMKLLEFGEKAARGTREIARWREQVQWSRAEIERLREENRRLRGDP